MRTRRQVEERLIDATLERSLAEDGFEPDMVEAALNTIEFSLRENNTGSYPRGLGLFMRTLRAWTYGLDPIEPLGYETPLAVVKGRIAADPTFLQRLIQLYLLDNTHRLTVLLTPDPDHNARLEAAEQERLDARQGGHDAGRRSSGDRQHSRAQAAPGDARRARRPGKAAHAQAGRPRQAEQAHPTPGDRAQAGAHHLSRPLHQRHRLPARGL